MAAAVCVNMVNSLIQPSHQLQSHVHAAVLVPHRRRGRQAQRSHRALAAVQPVGWWLNDHVTEGKAELNFSEFATYSTKRAVRKLRSTADEVRERHMPLKSYLFAHSEAKLTDADVVTLTNWAEELADEVESR